MDTQNDDWKSLESLDEVAEHFLQQLRDGRCPSVAAYRLAFPQWGEEIADLFPTLVELEDLDPLARSMPPLGPCLDVPDQLGDYLIQREIGRGGMGVVYEADHVTMRRRVALKLMPISNQPQRKKRFLREARAAGQLHHTNIVPVFEVGENLGYCYYAMQYIEGHNLDVIIDEMRKLAKQQSKNRSSTLEQSGFEAATKLINLRRNSLGVPDATRSLAKPEPTGSEPSVSAKTTSNRGTSRESGSSEWSKIGESNDCYFRRVAKVGVQISEALHFAHAQGVLHRDIKPSNLILDTGGNVWITDFGLAKDGSDDLTHTGDIVGTLRYMAPERFEQDADVASEIYSIGLTLYELCTLQPAYDQNDKVRLMKQIQAEDPVSPRRIRPEIPVDLETVIAKAIAREPRQRYASAQLLADDLKRFLADRPVLARRVSIPEKLYRWARRNPATAALASCLMLIAVLITGGSLYVAEMTRHHAAELSAENQRVIDEKTKTEEALAAAERAQWASQAHLYYTHLEKAQALLGNGRQGQRFDCLKSLQLASNIVPKLGLKPEQAERRYRNLRNVAASALSYWDLETPFHWQTSHQRSSTVAFDFTGRRAARADQDGNLLLYHFGEPTPHAMLPSPGAQAWLATFSPDGRYLAARYHDAIQVRQPYLLVWDLEKEQITGRVDNISLAAWHVFDQHSQRIAVVSGDSTIQIRSLVDWNRQAELVPGGHVDKILFADKGDQLLVSNHGSKSVDFHSLAEAATSLTKQVPLEFEATAMAWNDERRLLAVAEENVIQVRNLEHPEQPPIELTGHRSRIVRLWLHPQHDLLMSSSWDGTSRLYDLSLQKEVLRIEGKRLVDSGFDPSGRHIGFLGEANEFGIWQLPEQLADTILLPPATHLAHGNGVYLPGHPELVALAASRQVQIWNHHTRRMIQYFPCGRIRRIRIAASEQAILVGGDDGIQKWKYRLTDDEDHPLKLEPPELLWDRGVRDFDYSTQLQLVVGAVGNQVQTLDLVNRQVTDLGSHTNLSQLSFINGGRQVASTPWQGRGVRIWKRDAPGKFVELASNATNAALAEKPDKPILAIITGQLQMAVDRNTGQVIESIPREKPDGWAGGISYSPAGPLVAATWSRYVPHLIDSRTGLPCVSLEGRMRFSLGDLHWNQTGRFLSIADSGNLQVWDVQYLRVKFKELGIDWDGPDSNMAAVDAATSFIQQASTPQPTMPGHPTAASLNQH